MTNHLYDALFQPHVDREAPFLILSDGRIETYRAFLDRAARIAHVITDMGLVPGDRLAVQVAKSPEALSVYVACVQAGVIFLPLNTAYTASEVDYFVGDATPKILLCDQKAAADLQPIAQGHGAQILTLNADGSGSLMDAANQAPGGFTTRARGRDDLAAFLGVLPAEIPVMP
ncbi:MAG: AMP-binding protein, partial [Alphaproteobacteria bacterium]|nr:AMP-binding protein [Alphaproteobacteria bacterium]